MTAVGAAPSAGPSTMTVVGGIPVGSSTMTALGVPAGSLAFDETQSAPPVTSPAAGGTSAYFNVPGGGGGAGNQSAYFSAPGTGGSSTPKTPGTAAGESPANPSTWELELVKKEPSPPSLLRSIRARQKSL